MKKPIDIWFEQSGTNIYLCRELVYRQQSGVHVCRPNFEFSDTIKITKRHTYRSSVYFELESTTTPHIYYMNPTEFFNMTVNGIINKGIISGTWTFARRGPKTTLKFIHS